MYSRVERHSPCPVFTSLEFKWPTGRLRLPFTSRHLHFPLHKVHSQLLIRPHPSTLHTVPTSHTHTVQTSIHMLSFFILLTQTKIYCIVETTYNHSQAQMCTWHKHSMWSYFFLLEYPFVIQSPAINHPVITHSHTCKPTNLFFSITHTSMQTQIHAAFI